MPDEIIDQKEMDYSLPWVRGWEYVIQEGSGTVQRLREERGWTRDDVYDLTGGSIDPNTLGLIEGEYGPGVPWEVDQLVELAVVFDMKPGELLDLIYEEKGRELLAEETRDGR